MDDLDRAQTLNDLSLAHALQQRKPEGPAATGRCLYCEEPTEKRWCNAWCRDTWQEERRVR